MTLQEEFQYFIEHCTKSPNSFKNYHSGLVSFVDERLKVLVKDYKGIYSYASSETVSHFMELLKKDDVFKERDGSTRANKMYSNSLTSYLQFLKARDFFKKEHAEGHQVLASTQPFQQIFFGAPGTGKSFEIKKQTKGKEVIRTTFHPDSDYSTFVGAYKPTMKEEYFRDLSGHLVFEKGKAVMEEKIVYEFVEQAFLQAYTKAWKFYAEAQEGEAPKEQFLVIEEINRGNCAQIFGDIFQLLDRNDSGFSDYPIKADDDMRKQLAKSFEGLTVPQCKTINALYDEDDIVKQVLSGEVLLLPDNLFIWATMNTSDQSLFPIDSAFKRRWDWKYVPISEGTDDQGVLLKWKIAANDDKYDWWEFLKAINARIQDTTSSEDKELGYFFCKAKDGIISAETFVNKVIFYLWNDVFKNYEFDDKIFDDKNGAKLTFDKFYNADTKDINEANVAQFLENLDLQPLPKDETEGEDEGSEDSSNL